MPLDDPTERILADLLDADIEFIVVSAPRLALASGFPSAPSKPGVHLSLCTGLS